MFNLMPSRTTKDEESLNAKIAVLPIGSFEQHGPYLPLITDTAIACIIASSVAEAYPVRYLPPVTVSCSHEHEAWSGTASISARTLYAIVSDIQDSLHRSGIHKLVLVNGHGGNYVLRNVVQEASVESQAMALFPTGADWVRARIEANMATSDHEDMHAGELEVSILLHGCPKLVHSGFERSDHVASECPDILTLGMAAYTPSGIIGRPSLASAAKGKSAVNSLIGSFARCLEILTDSTGLAARQQPG
jgi:creatinine amidohydrolase